MAFNGITIHALKDELKDMLVNTHISKISEPEYCELLITVKLDRGTKRLLISANASLPIIYLTDTNKQGPLKAPNFCMLLRKHIQGGLIKEIEQMGLDRVIRFTIEKRNELGDIEEKYLYVEIMNKYSNIIFTDKNDIIIDSIKHVPSSLSSVREVLPGKKYFIPAQEDEIDPVFSDKETFYRKVFQKSTSLCNALVSSFQGFSPVTANELCFRAGLDSNQAIASLDDEMKERLYFEFQALKKALEERDYHPSVYFSGNSDKPYEFSVFELKSMNGMKMEKYETISEMLESFYRYRDIYASMHQRSTDLRKIITNLLSRNKRKYDLQIKQLKDTDKAGKYRKKGELLRAYQYMLKDGDEKVEVNDYESGKDVTITIDPTLTIMENANRFFDKYNKLKRTREELSLQIKKTEETLYQLESIRNAIDISESSDDLDLIRQEMEEDGFIRNKQHKAKKTAREKPLEFETIDGFKILVGKNNYQNDHITFHMSSPDDWWFHAKGIPGSHVLLKTEGREVPDRDFEIASSIAGYYSSGRDQNKIEIDYLRKKDVKKPNGAKPGYVIYYTNYSIVVKPEIRDAERLKD